MPSEIPTLDLSDNLVDVVLVVGLAVIGDGELSVGGLSSAVAVGKVVDDDLQKLLGAGALAQRAGIGEISTKIWDLRDGIYRLQW